MGQLCHCLDLGGHSLAGTSRAETTRFQVVRALTVSFLSDITLTEGRTHAVLLCQQAPSAGVEVGWTWRHLSGLAQVVINSLVWEPEPKRRGALRTQDCRDLPVLAEDAVKRAGRSIGQEPFSC